MERIQIIIKRTLILFSMLVACGVIGQLLLIMAYCLPTEVIALNIGRGAESLVHQGAEYNYAEDYTESILDNATDAIMLSEALFPSESCVEGAALVPHYVYADKESQVFSLMAFLNHDDLSDVTILNYPRYWHGYLTILKPLFCMFDYSDFKIINQAIQLTIISTVLVLMMKKGLEKYIVAFLPMLVIWNPATMGVSLQYAACFYVSMIGSIIVLCRETKKDWLLFFGLGVATSYLDFLTYPIVTFGIPMIFLIIKKAENLEKPIERILVNGVHWAIGYVGMWASKWIIGTTISHENIISDAFSNIESRTSIAVDGENITRIGAVIRLTDAAFFKWTYVLMLLGVVVYLFIKNYKKFKLNPATIALLAISIMPIVWFMFTANHSYIHPRLVYRNWGITVFALLSVPVTGAREKVQGKDE